MRWYIVWWFWNYGDLISIDEYNNARKMGGNRQNYMVRSRQENGRLTNENAFFDEGLDPDDLALMNRLSRKLDEEISLLRLRTL